MCWCVGVVVFVGGVCFCCGCGCVCLLVFVCGCVRGFLCGMHSVRCGRWRSGVEIMIKVYYIYCVSCFEKELKLKNLNENHVLQFFDN